MGRRDVERALRAMDDEETRERLSQGDFEAVGGLDLTDEERTLVRDAAGDYPEVAGFSFDTFLQFGGIEGEAQDAKHKPEIDVFSRSKFTLAISYAKISFR